MEAFDFQYGHLIVEAASEAILRALEDGHHKGHVGAWVRESADHHVHRAILHLIKGETPDELSKEERHRHLQHALCRIAMALALDRYQVKAVAMALPPRPADYAEAA